MGPGSVVSPAQTFAFKGMSRIRALLFFGGLALMIAGYVAWCSRTFWVVVAFPDLSLIPENQRAAAEAAIEAAGLTKPDPFSPELMLKFLMKPFDTAPRPVSVSVFKEPLPPPRIYLHVDRTRRNPRNSEHPVVFFWSGPPREWGLLTTPWGKSITRVSHSPKNHETGRERMSCN
jgi:hypothetical protein